MVDERLTPGLCAQLACVWEVTARKPGNVHRYCDFADATYLDFLTSAAAITPVLKKARTLGVGRAVLRCIEATRLVASSNTNLGIVLLLTPLAAALSECPLRAGVKEVLDGLTIEDSRRVYRAIRLAHPGGLGQVSDQDVAAEPTLPLVAVMALAQEQDMVARQYATAYRDVWEVGLPALQHALAAGAPVEGAILACHLTWMARYPDSLIVRKWGAEVGEQVRNRAAQVLARGWASGNGDWDTLTAFDRWLRDPSQRRNPGTTADLVTATLFVALRTGQVNPAAPFALPNQPFPR